jgi:outer membrane protein assembly factor BamA
VKFVSVTTQPVSPTAVAVSTQIEEGIAYRLGDVRVAGEGVDSAALLKAAKLPIGKLANWKETRAGVAEAQGLLRRDGYLRAVALPERSFRNDTGTVDLVIEVTRGPQFRFGQLRIRGLDSARNQGAQALEADRWRTDEWRIRRRISQRGAPAT